MWLIGYIIICLLIADFLSGIFHWLEDTYTFSHIPFIGGFLDKYITVPNIEHHNNPGKFLEGSFWHRNYTTIIPSFIATIIFGLINPYFILPFIILGFANEIHAMAHRKYSGIIKVLQDIGIFQGSKNHGLHHKNLNNSNYCVITNFVNPALEYIDFWRCLENFVLLLKYKYVNN